MGLTTWKKTITESALLFLYMVFVLLYTVFGRAITVESPKIEVFWTIKGILSGNYKIGEQIIGNICLFVPVGFLLSSINKNHRILVVLFCGLFLSAIIETLQYVLMRGLFEIDDLIYNSLGVLIGGKLLIHLEKHLGLKIVKSISIGLGVIFVGLSIFVYFASSNVRVDTSASQYCFQLDKVGYNSGSIELSGFCFQYSNNCNNPKIALKSTKTRNTIPLEVTYKIKRDDVNQYFSCDNDYTAVGFYAVGNQICDEEYEVLLNLDWPILISTGVYIKEGQVYYTKSDTYTPPRGGKDLDEIVNNGILRVDRPKEHCWIYQYHGYLYWIVDTDFDFEKTGKTVIQYQLETTQKGKLPEYRLENGWMWDNLSASFEEHEINGDFGAYRVMKRELPSDYSITSIETGYYKNGNWLWRSFFRPIYEFPVL